MMVVMMIGRAFVFVRIAWPVVIMIVVVVVAMFMHGGDDIAGVGRNGTTVHADEHANHHDSLDK